MPRKSLGELLASEPEIQNQRLIKSLYQALGRGDSDTITKLVTSDLEWWYHGPPHCQHLMRVLTGDTSAGDRKFRFRPRSIRAVDDRVIVEGWEGSEAYWVHVWTVEQGMVTQLREYFDTWVTVILRCSDAGCEVARLWQSSHRQRLKRSLPDVVLAV